MGRRCGSCAARGRSGRGSGLQSSTGEGNPIAGAPYAGVSSEGGAIAIGLDTSVVVRLLVGLPEGQAGAARRRLERAVEGGERVLVSDLVLAEAYYALHHHYGLPKAEARSILHRFATSGTVTVDPIEAVAALEVRSGAGLVDRLIHTRYRSLGVVTTTFERKQGALEGAARLRVRS